AAALLPTAVASAALHPVRRSFGDLQIPLGRARTIPLPKGHVRGRVTVLVTLAAPPLAASFGRRLSASAGSRRLDVRSAGSREDPPAPTDPPARAGAPLGKTGI